MQNSFTCDHFLAYGSVDLFDGEDGRRSMLTKDHISTLQDVWPKMWEELIVIWFNHCPLCGKKLR